MSSFARTCSGKHKPGSSRGGILKIYYIYTASLSKGWVLFKYFVAGSSEKEMFSTTNFSFVFPFPFCFPKLSAGWAGRDWLQPLFALCMWARVTEAEIKHGRECSKVVRQEKELPAGVCRPLKWTKWKERMAFMRYALMAKEPQATHGKTDRD